MATLQGSRPLPRQHSSYFPPAPSSNQQSSSDMETPLKHNVFRFPLTKNILWDQTPVGSSFQLHPMHSRNISLHVFEAAVRLAHRHALQADVQPYHGFLVGSVQVDADEEGLTVSLDRFDPGRDVPGRTVRLPTARLPADFIVPLTTCLGDADISATHTSEDFIAAFKLLESNVNTHGSVDPSRCLTLRVLCRCHSNADDITFSLHFGAVTVATVLNGFPVKPVPIIPTALARNLMGPLSLSDVQGSYKTGFLSMDETRKLLLLLESDPKATTIPLVGIWLSGITHMSNPVVWSACLRYLNSTGIQERVCSPDGGFLVVLFTRTSRQPLFYQCKVKSEQEPRFMLVGCRENLHVFKHVSGKGKPPLEMELTPARSGPSKSLFMQSLAHLRSSQKHPISSSRRRSSATDSMSVEESHLIPRPSPKPILDKSPSVMPSVPELSFISDSFCEPTDQKRKDQVAADVHPQRKEGHTIHRQRLNGQSDVLVKGTDKQMSVHRRRLHGTSKTPPQGHQQHSPGMKGTIQTSRPNRPGPLRTLNGQELNDNRKKGGHSSETHDMRKRATQPKDKAGKVLHTKSSGYGLHQKHANGPRQGRHSAVRSNQQHSSECNTRDRQICPSVHGRQGNRMQHQQQPKVSFQDQVEFDIEPSPDIIANHLCYQDRSDAVSVKSILPPHQQPDTPTGHYHSPINNLINAQPTLPSHSPSTVPTSISQEGQFYPDTSDHHHHQDNATTNSPFHPAPKTVTSPGHLHPMTTSPEENVLSPEHSVTQKSKDVVGVQSASSSIDRRSNAPVSGDQSQSREPSDMDIRTLEQLRRQEEMIQQLQEQIKLLLQAHSPHPSTSTPLGLMTPPATPQGAQNMVQSPPVHSPAETGSFRSHPDSIQPPSATVPSSHRHHVRDATAPQSTAAVKPDTTSVATLVVHQQTAIATSIEQSLKTPVMCSMAVNTGQSLFWSVPVDVTDSDAPGSPRMKSDQANPKITRQSSMTTPVLSPMPDPDSTSTPVATQCGQERQPSDIQEGFTDVFQTRKNMERVDIRSCQETTRKSSHSTESSEQHTPSHSPERSHQDESNHTFGANLSSPTLGESASTYAPPRPQTDSSDSEDEEDEEDRRVMEKEKRTSMASPSLLYRDERKFYDNLLGQVQQLLHTDGTERTSTPEPVISEGTTDPDLPRALPDISLATLEELEKLGINLHSKDITVTERSLYRSLYNVSPDLHPHINYVSLADFTFDPSDLSMEANAIAMKYLSDSELAKMSADIQGDKTPGRRGAGVNPLLRSVLTGIRGDGGASGRGSDVDSSIGVNMSLASRKYMEKYGLLSGGEGAASPRGDGHLLKPSPIRFMKSPAIVRTNLPRDGMKEDKRGVKARPTRLSYSPSREMDSHPTEGIGLNAPRDANPTSDPQPPNVLGNLKAQKLDKSEEDSGAKGNILDISKLKQLPKLL